jgi:hypothetical protein
MLCALRLSAQNKKPSREDRAFCVYLLVPKRGIEPTTFALRMRRSWHLLVLT